MEKMLETGRATKGIKKSIAAAAKEAGLRYHLQVWNIRNKLKYQISWMFSNWRKILQRELKISSSRLDLHDSGIIGLIFKFNFWIFEKDFKVLSLFIQKWIQPPACLDHSLYRIFSSFWLAHFYLMHYFGLDSGMFEFFLQILHEL